VAASPAHLECKLHQLVELPADPRSGKRNVMIIGHVVGIHIDDAYIVNGVSTPRVLGRSHAWFI